MSQSATHPHDISNLLEPALIDIVHAVSDLPGLTTAAYEAKADATWALLESFRPRDVIDLMLSGQLIAFSAVFADATGGLLRGMDDTLKKQTLSSLISIGRVTQGHLDRLAKRGNQPYRTEIAAEPPAVRPNAAATAPVVEPPPVTAPRSSTPPPAAATVKSAALSPVAAAPSAAPPSDTHAPSASRSSAVNAAPGPDAAPASPSLTSDAAPCPAMPEARSPWPDAPTRAGFQPPVAETSWLDEPYQEYVIETPGLLLAQEQTARTAAVLRLMEATQRDTGVDGRAADAVSEPEAADAS